MREFYRMIREFAMIFEAIYMRVLLDYSPICDRLRSQLRQS